MIQGSDLINTVKVVDKGDIASEEWSKSGDGWTWPQLMYCALSQSSVLDFR
jgi:hypothetical protein